jgi:hypothetical protein
MPRGVAAVMPNLSSRISKSIKTGLKNANKVIYISLESVSSLDHDQNKITGLRELGSRDRQDHVTWVKFYEADKSVAARYRDVVFFPPTFSIPELLRTKIPDLFPALNRNLILPTFSQFPDSVGKLGYKL